MRNAMLDQDPVLDEIVRRIVEAFQTERVVCLDGGFAGNDSPKADAVQASKNKGVTGFKTV